MWQNLIQMSQTVNLPWLVTGDFNEVAFPNEKFGGNPPNIFKMQKYKETMDACGLHDLGFIGSKYTWFNKRKSYPILERLDRGWACDKWTLSFPDATVNNLPRLSSDHNPVLISLKKSIPLNRNKFFKFELMWMQNRTFDPWLRQKWATLDLNMYNKLNDLSREIPVWALNANDVNRKKKKLQARIAGVQRAYEADPSNSFLFDLEVHLNKDLNLTLDQEEDFWFIRARTDWLVNGDRNTKFFISLLFFEENPTKFLY